MEALGFGSAREAPYRWRQSGPQVLGVMGSGAGSSTGGWGAPGRQGGMGGATDS